MVQYTGARAAILSNVELRNDGNDNDIAETGGELMPPAVVCSQQATSVEGDEEDGLSADVCAKQPRNDQSLPPPYRPKLELDEAQKQTVETMNYNIMVVGGCSLGKTTACDSMLNRFTDLPSLVAEARRNNGTAVKDKRRDIEAIEEKIGAIQRELDDLMKRLQGCEGCDESNEHEYDRAKEMEEEVAQLKVEKETHEADEHKLQMESNAKLDQIDALMLEIDEVKAEAQNAGPSELKDIKKWEKTKRDALRSLRQEVFPQPRGAEESNSVLQESTVQIEERVSFSFQTGEHQTKTFNVTLTDTPGYGDKMDATEAIRPIHDEIEKRLRVHMEQHKNFDAKVQLSDEDQLIHVVLYFIQPHRFSGIDRAFMRELHSLVNIVPIIAKADSMSSTELKEFKAHLNKEIAKEGIEVYHFPKNLIIAEQDRIKQMLCSQPHFLQECPLLGDSFKEAAQNYQLMTPFSVIASKDHEPDTRHYPFGVAKGTNPLHSDFPSLCQLVISKGPIEVRKEALKRANLWAKNHEAREQAEEARVAEEEKTARLAADAEELWVTRWLWVGGFAAVAFACLAAYFMTCLIGSGHGAIGKPNENVTVDDLLVLNATDTLRKSKDAHQAEIAKWSERFERIKFFYQATTAWYALWVVSETWSARRVPFGGFSVVSYAAAGCVCLWGYLNTEVYVNT